MKTKLEKDVRFLKVYAVFATIICAVLLLTAFSQTNNKKFEEIDVERINIVEKDGKLDLVISNKARQHPGIVDGKLIERDYQRPPGILFFNHVGDEAGGLVVGDNGGKGHFLSFTFDKTRNDQTIALQHFESDNGKYWAGLKITDRPNISLHDTTKSLKEIEKISDKSAKDAALKKLRDQGDFGFDRLTLGKGRDESSAINLMDKNGKPRIVISVDIAGNPKLNFLDENGKVIESYPKIYKDKK